MNEEFWTNRVLRADIDQLYEDLARYSIGTEFARELVVSGQIDKNETVGFDSTKELGLLGRKVFSRISHRCFDIICSESSEGDTREKLLKAVGVSDAAAISLLTQIMVSDLHLSVPLAAAGSALILNAILKPMTGGVCDYWKAKL